MLPSWGTLATCTLFLAHAHFYQNISHLWMSAQIIGIIFATYLGSPRHNALFFLCNVLIPPCIAFFCDHLDALEIIHRQAIVYFASITSIFLSHSQNLQRKTLAKARNEAMESQKIKSQFLANMSHEIRTPLNAIIGYSEIIQEDAKEAGQKELLEQISKVAVSGQHLLHLVNDILDIAKIESGAKNTKKESFSFLEFTKEIKTVIDPLMEKRKNTFHLKVSVTGEFCSDRLALKQILINLLSNAAKFTENGAVTLVVQEKGKGETYFAVKDTGTGIAKEDLEIIFHKFEQVHDVNKQPLAGSGLGLSIARALVEDLGGELTVRSGVGVGSIFEFTLPKIDHS